MCIFIQYLTFPRTNLLTRCHNASSCFLLFLYFRKVVQEIFPELHGTKTQCLIIPSRTARRGPEGGPQCGHTLGRCGPQASHAGPVSGPPWPPATPPLRLFILHIRETLDTREKIHEKFCSHR